MTKLYFGNFAYAYNIEIIQKLIVHLSAYDVSLNLHEQINSYFKLLIEIKITTCHILLLLVTENIIKSNLRFWDTLHN